MTLRMIASAAMLACIATPSGAQQAAWDVASRYVCTADALRICRDRRPRCTSEDPLATFFVDFEAGTFRAASVEPERAEQIVYRGFHQFQSGFPEHVAVLSGGARMLQFHGPRRTGGPSGPGMDATFVAIYGSTVYISSLFCTEQR